MGPRVALVSGFWGQNIGNAFFNVGGRWVLEQVFGPSSVQFIQDQPGYRTFHDQAKGNPLRDWGLLQHLDIDYIVLQGPVLTETFAQLWRPTLQALTARGTQIILLGAAFFRYTAREIVAACDFLRECPPVLVSTRDSKTYEIVKAVVPATHDGIDSAFFMPKAVEPLRLVNRQAYIVMAFDRFPEPEYRLSPGDQAGLAPGVFAHNGHVWSWSQPAIQRWFSNKGKWQAYVGALLDRRQLPRELAGYQIVRAEHRFNPHITWKIYARPNAVASDEPFTYATLYANTHLTLSDRVHASVLTLAYGNDAMLYSPSPRAALFERIGCSDIVTRPVRLDLDRLEQWRQDELDFITGVLD